MTFGEAWDTFSVGALVAISDGTPPPSTNTNGIPYHAWKSNNFTGTLVDKSDGEWRSMRFEFTNALGNTIGYTMIEGRGHQFTAA